jgi:hypothetical protein
MVEITASGGNVRFTVIGRDRFYALRRKVDVPAAHITGVRRAEDLTRPAGIRLFGTALPGVIYAGSFRGGGRWTFWDVRAKNRDRAIAVDIEHEHYAQLVVEVADPDAAIRTIEDARASVGVSI